MQEGYQGIIASPNSWRSKLEPLRLSGGTLGQVSSLLLNILFCLYLLSSSGGACWKLLTCLLTKSARRRSLPTSSTSHFSSRLPPPPPFLGFSKSPSLISRLLLSSKWLSNLPTLGQASNWISKFFPTNRKHRISNFALRHNNSQFILCRAQIVAGLITKTDLVHRII